MAQSVRIESKQIIEIHSPATLNKIGEVAIDTAADVRVAVVSARAAFQQWRTLSIKERAKILLSARDLLLARHEEIVQLLWRCDSISTGKSSVQRPVVQSRLQETTPGRLLKLDRAAVRRARQR